MRLEPRKILKYYEIASDEPADEPAELGIESFHAEEYLATNDVMASHQIIPAWDSGSVSDRLCY
ncbi:hypothetical protein ENSA5_52840 [Enhygromyxa salina]|uniref:Uncharacterized protein n=1 Tax=Enhygromyxa salina TaxID=215803 RepID=A0A2S9XFR0_9BACT|nr:hypothetical protein [Enhygromyxa salina]PRP91704.1 hypothetical protein ENSA5_52840 [Enhygromyxa salina]